MDIQIDEKNDPSFHEDFVRQITECLLQISLLGPA